MNAAQEFLSLLNDGYRMERLHAERDRTIDTILDTWGLPLPQTVGDLKKIMKQIHVAGMRTGFSLARETE